MNLIDKRAIKIVQLQEELEEAKRIITDFVWPSDGTKESRQRFEQKAARFAGCTVPIFDGQPERPNSLENEALQRPDEVGSVARSGSPAKRESGPQQSGEAPRSPAKREIDQGVPAAAGSTE